MAAGVLLICFIVVTTVFAQQLPGIGRDYYHGYFTNDDNIDWNFAGAVFEWPAYQDVNDVNAFVEKTRKYLYNMHPVESGRPLDNQAGAAAYVIDTMLGKKGPEFGGSWSTGVQYAKNNFAEWESRVRYYDSKGWVNYNDIATICPPYDHYNQNYRISDVFGYRVGSGDCMTDPVITFNAPDGSYYRLLKHCGNPNGALNPLVPPPPPPPPPRATAECGAMPLPGVLPLNSGYTLRPTAKATNYAIGPSGNPRFSLWVKDPTGATNTYPLTYTAAGGTMTASYNFVGTIGGIYHFQWYLQFPDNPSLNLTCRAGAATPITTPSSDPSDPTHPNNPNNPTRPVGTGTTDQIKVGYQPFFSVVGGDISAGVPGSGPNADIRSWNANGGSYTGAGSQIGALATGDIQNFITAIAMAGAASDGKFAALAFSNIGGVTTGGANTKTYGGGFQATPNKQVPNVSGAVARPESSIDVGSLASGVYLFDRDLTITGTVGAGKSVTVVVTTGHHVIVGGNLLYSYGNFAEVPRLNVVVQGGNVYVDSGVSEIHGVFNVSNTPTPGTGMFVSCANGTTPVDLNTATGYARCNTPLTIFGSVTAQSLLLNRTTGHWATGGSGSAETFVYSPEIWLAPRAGGSGTGSGTTGNYESYISLPPVL